MHHGRMLEDATGFGRLVVEQRAWLQRHQPQEELAPALLHTQNNARFLAGTYGAMNMSRLSAFSGIQKLRFFFSNWFKASATVLSYFSAAVSLGVRQGNIG